MKILFVLSLLFTLNVSAENSVELPATASLRQVESNRCFSWRPFQHKNSGTGYACSGMPSTVHSADFNSTLRVVSDFERRIKALEARILELEGK